MTWLDRLLKEDPRGMVPRSAIDSTLEALCTGLPTEDARELREERAAILEHDGGLSRAEAEQRAGIPRIPVSGLCTVPGEEVANPGTPKVMKSTFANSSIESSKHEHPAGQA